MRMQIFMGTVLNRRMESPQTYYGLVLMLVCVGVGVRAYSNFVPPEACADMFPSGHRAFAKNSTPPFELLVSASSYTAGSTIKVTLNTTNPSKWYFLGMFVQARRATDCRQRTPVGTFSFTSGDDYLQTMNCSAANDAISHKMSDRTLTKEFTWTAPKIPVGHIYFRATVVNDFVTFWTDVFSDLVRGPKAAAPPATWRPCAAKQDHTDVTPTDTDVTPIDTDVTPTDTDVTPTDTDMTPTDTDVTPTDTDVTPTDTDVTPTDTDVTPTDTDVTPTYTNVTTTYNTGVTTTYNTGVTTANNTNVTTTYSTRVTTTYNTDVTTTYSTRVTPANAAFPFYPHVLPLVGAILVALLAL